jgi:hypothetical protein
MHRVEISSKFTQKIKATLTCSFGASFTHEISNTRTNLKILLENRNRLGSFEQSAQLLPEIFASTEYKVPVDSTEHLGRVCLVSLTNPVTFSLEY